MDTVNVKREELLTRIKANRDAHRELFLKAQDGYRVKVIEELDRMLADAREGRKIRRAIQLAEPEDHTADYDRIVDMLTMSQDEIIEIDAHAFGCYVRDEWSWKRKATLLNTTYSSGASMYVAEAAAL